jgi:peptide/nickel transport system substrate-binding protein
MRKLSFLVSIVFILAIAFVSDSFSQQMKPQYGGVFKFIYTQPPQMMSYTPMMGPSDSTNVMPAVERLMEATKDRTKNGGIEPNLVEKVDEDVNGLKITWHVRKGIKFHDGTELTADVVRWNFQQVIDAKSLPYSKYLKDMKVTDKYTLVFDLTEYSNQLVASWGYWPIIVSKEAWEKASGGDLAKGKEWARTHCVGTGPFMLKEYKRDVSLTWVKNPNYWRKGKPYLDGIEVRFIPDSVTASAMVQAKEVDGWNGAPPKDQVELMKKGFKRQSSWPALGNAIWINTAHPKSKWQDKKLREALEYALDKDAIAKAMGFGLYIPLKSLPPKGEWGYDPNYNPRPYNPEKAKELVAAAGYPNGLNAKLMVFFTPDAKEAGTAVKQYLDAAGFQIELDVADPGRFFSTVYGAPPGPDADLYIWITGRDNNYLQAYMRWFSTEPFSNLPHLGHTPEQEKLDKEAQKLTSLKAQEAVTKKVMRYLTDNALLIPLYDMPAATIQQPWVHSTQYETGFTRWMTEDIWMEKH